MDGQLRNLPAAIIFNVFLLNVKFMHEVKKVKAFYNEADGFIMTSSKTVLEQQQIC